MASEVLLAEKGSAAATVTATAYGGQRRPGGRTGGRHGPSPLGSAQLGPMSGGRVLGGKLAPEVLTTTTVWMNLPAELRATTANLWTRLQGAPWFVGLPTGGRPGRIGFSVWGPAPVCRKLAAELGAEVKQPKTLARVYGYGPGFGLDACDAESYAPQKICRVWPALEVKPIEYQHLTHSGLQTFALTLEGVLRDSR